MDNYLDEINNQFEEIEETNEKDDEYISFLKREKVIGIFELINEIKDEFNLPIFNSKDNLKNLLELFEVEKSN